MEIRIAVPRLPQGLVANLVGLARPGRDGAGGRRPDRELVVVGAGRRRGRGRAAYVAQTQAPRRPNAAAEPAKPALAVAGKSA
jgi:hypothetical protein